jgi:hypothetical protein
LAGSAVEVYLAASEEVVMWEIEYVSHKTNTKSNPDWFACTEMQSQTMIYIYSNPKPNVQFAFYMYVVGGDSSVTIIRPGSGAIVYDVLFCLFGQYCVCVCWLLFCSCMLVTNLWLCWQNVRFCRGADSH